MPFSKSNAACFSGHDFRTTNLRAGTPLGVALAINLTALRLKSGVGYSLVFSVDGDARPEWRSQLFVKAAK